MKWFSDMILNFVIRMMIGITMIFLINQLFVSNNLDVSVGINPLTAVTSGILGVPGVCLLYGIVFFPGI